MTRQRTGDNPLKAGAAGDEAFWQGKPIWLNPHIGDNARDWTRRWRQAEDEYLGRSGAVKLAVGERYSAEALRPYRPAGIPEAPRRVIHSAKGHGNRGEKKPHGILYGDPFRRNERSTRFLPGETPWKRT
jgi:hypothetical protein